MADEIDRAQEQEHLHRIFALARAKPQAGPCPNLIDGVPCCADCGLEIPAARLQALPGVGLCRACAEDREQEFFA